MHSRTSFPHYRNKWPHRSLVEAREFVRIYHRRFRAPRRLAIIWNPRVARSLARRWKARRVAPSSTVYRLPGHAGSVGFLLPRGVGAPTTIVECEELAAAGTREFVGVGFAGGLAHDLGPGDVVVCDRAIRDEGTSHHYAPSHVPATPSPTLRRWLERTLRRSELPFRVGPSWTTDAPYRETLAELRHFRRQGVLTVDMEASAIFLFGRSRRVRTASVFVISDRLTEQGWHPHFHRQRERLAEVAELVLRTWAGTP
jgi:uridine phosphorylase